MTESGRFKSGYNKKKRWMTTSLEWQLAWPILINIFCCYMNTIWFGKNYWEKHTDSQTNQIRIFIVWSVRWFVSHHHQHLFGPTNQNWPRRLVVGESQSINGVTSWSIINQNNKQRMLHKLNLSFFFSKLKQMSTLSYTVGVCDGCVLLVAMIIIEKNLGTQHQQYSEAACM